MVLSKMAAPMKRAFRFIGRGTFIFFWSDVGCLSVNNGKTCHIVYKLMFPNLDSRNVRHKFGYFFSIHKSASRIEVIKRNLGY